jgi:hypothetical protein
MFTQQMPAFARALDGALSPGAVRQLMQVFGNCNQPLEHRAPVTIRANALQSPGWGGGMGGGGNPGNGVYGDLGVGNAPVGGGFGGGGGGGVGGGGGGFGGGGGGSRGAKGGLTWSPTVYGDILTPLTAININNANSTVFGSQGNVLIEVPWRGVGGGPGGGVSLGGLYNNSARFFGGDAFTFATNAQFIANNFPVNVELGAPGGGALGGGALGGGATGGVAPAFGPSGPPGAPGRSVFDVRSGRSGRDGTDGRQGRDGAGFGGSFFPGSDPGSGGLRAGGYFLERGAAERIVLNLDQLTVDTAAVPIQLPRYKLDENCDIVIDDEAATVPWTIDIPVAEVEAGVIPYTFDVQGAEYSLKPKFGYP